MQVSTDADAQLELLYSEMEELQLQGLWRLNEVIQSPEPRVATRPYRWKGEDVSRVLFQAGDLVKHSAAAERRTLRLVNPGHPATNSATHTLAAAVQLLKPGEVAPTHRHSPVAIRFLIQGTSGYTTVEGERCTMAPGDLILTPRWTWHHHGNDGDQPVMWMDGLDFPLVLLLNMQFFEPYPGGATQPEDQPHNGSLQRYHGAGLTPVADGAGSGRPPLLIYRWDDTYAALQQLAAVSQDPHDDVAMEYVDPRTGGSVTPTLGCRIQLLRPGVETTPHRHASSAVYHVFRGSGHSVIAGQRIDWQQGDFFALPTWAEHHHANPGSEEAILFSITDQPAMEALGLYRESA
jgi:gentisate 1,2-dioxygenase